MNTNVTIGHWRRSRVSRFLSQPFSLGAWFPRPGSMEPRRARKHHGEIQANATYEAYGRTARSRRISLRHWMLRSYLRLLLIPYLKRSPPP